MQGRARGPPLSRPRASPARSHVIEREPGQRRAPCQPARAVKANRREAGAAPDARARAGTLCAPCPSQAEPSRARVPIGDIRGTRARSAAHRRQLHRIVRGRRRSSVPARRHARVRPVRPSRQDVPLAARRAGAARGALLARGRAGGDADARRGAPPRSGRCRSSIRRASPRMRRARASRSMKAALTSGRLLPSSPPRRQGPGPRPSCPFLRGH